MSIKLFMLDLGIMNASHPSTVVLVGTLNRSLKISPVTELIEATNFE